MRRLWKRNFALFGLILALCGASSVAAQTQKTTAKAKKAKPKAAVKQQTAAKTKSVKSRRAAAKTSNEPALERLDNPAANAKAAAVSAPVKSDKKPVAASAAKPNKKSAKAKAGVASFVKEKPALTNKPASEKAAKTKPVVASSKPVEIAVQPKTVNIEPSETPRKIAAPTATAKPKPITVVQPDVAPPVVTSALLLEINALRTNPQSFIPHLEEFRKKFDAPRKPSADLQTVEGAAAVDEAIAFLRGAKSVSALRQMRGLDLAALEQLYDIRETGSFKQTAGSGEMPGERLTRFGDVVGDASNIIGRGKLSPREIIVLLLVGDGDKERVNRQKLFSPKFKTAGAVTGESEKFGGLSVIVLAENFVERY